MRALFKHITWKAVPIAAFAAGSAMLLAYVILAPLLLNVYATPLLRYNASILLGNSAISSSTAPTFILGIVIHYLFSLIFTFIIVVIIHRWGFLVGIVGGGILGLALYSINFFGFTLIFPRFFALNNRALLIAHIIFGVVAGGVYERLDNYDQPLRKETEHAQ